MVPSVVAPRLLVLRERIYKVRDGERLGPRDVGGVLVHRVCFVGGEYIGIYEIKCMSVFSRKKKLILLLHWKKKLLHLPKHIIFVNEVLFEKNKIIK